MNSYPPDLVVPLAINDVGSDAARTATDAAGTEALAHDRSSVNDFDFMVGDWHVRHRRTDPGKNQWVEFDGTSCTRATLDGAGNVEDNVIGSPSGTYRAKAIRAFDSATGQWAIWWIDGRNPHGKLDPPVIGRFANGVGVFYCDDTIDGVPTRMRFTWVFRQPDAARWEQAFSTDAGESWDTNWTMEFTRA